jgi:hypothetical protein
MTESLDEGMRGTGDPADYDAWADETPEDVQDFDPGDEKATRMVELATQIAQLAGLSVGPALAAEPVTPSVLVKLTCGRCNDAAFFGHLRLDTGVTREIYGTHLCGIGTNEPAVFPFTLAVRSGA